MKRKYQQKAKKIPDHFHDCFIFPPKTAIVFQIAMLPESCRSVAPWSDICLTFPIVLVLETTAVFWFDGFIRRLCFVVFRLET